MPGHDPVPAIGQRYDGQGLDHAHGGDAGGEPFKVAQVVADVARVRGQAARVQ